MVGKFSVDKIEETYSFCFTCLDLLIDLINNSKKVTVQSHSDIDLVCFESGQIRIR